MLKFLIPVDGSEPSTEAVKELQRYAGWLREEVEFHLLTVQPPMPYGNRVSSVVGRKAIAEYQEEEGLAALKPARKLLDAAKVPYRFHVGIGEAAEVIVRYAKDLRCDQIIMGTRGMGSLSGALLGSVAAKVVHGSPVPVLLMKKRAPARGKS